MKLLQPNWRVERGFPNEQGQWGRVLEDELKETALATCCRVLQAAQSQRFVHHNGKSGHVARLKPIAIHFKLCNGRGRGQDSILLGVSMPRAGL